MSKILTGRYGIMESVKQSAFRVLKKDGGIIMKIMNLHGFLGKADNRNYQALRELLPDAEIISPKLDFLRVTPERILDMLFITAAQENIDLIVGQSLGAAFGLITARRYGVPCILTNPCLEPEKTEIIMNSEISSELLAEYGKICFRQYFAKAYILLSDRDEIIPGNFDICKPLAPHVKLTGGTHSKLNDLKGELGALLKKLETPESRAVHLTDLFDKIDKIIVADDASTFDMSMPDEED